MNPARRIRKWAALTLALLACSDGEGVHQGGGGSAGESEATAPETPTVATANEATTASGAGAEAASEATARSAAPACEPAECAEGEGACEGDERRTCQGGKWQRSACDEAACKAAGKGPLQGCQLDDQDQPTCLCGCTVADEACLENGKVVQYCSDDGSVFRFACNDAFCKEAGYKGLKAGSGCQNNGQGAFCDCEPNCEVGITCTEQGGKASVTVCDGLGATTYTCDDVCKEDGQVASPECAGTNANGEKVCFCGLGKCTAEGQQKCVGNGKVQFCSSGVWLESACSDKACKDAGFSGWSGTCGVGSSGKESCLCN